MSQKIMDFLHIRNMQKIFPKWESTYAPKGQGKRLRLRNGEVTEVLKKPNRKAGGFEWVGRLGSPGEILIPESGTYAFPLAVGCPDANRGGADFANHACLLGNLDVGSMGCRRTKSGNSNEFSPRTAQLAAQEHVGRSAMECSHGLSKTAIGWKCS